MPGATYDCGGISDLGRRGEATVAPILAASRAATEAERAGIRQLIEHARGEFETQRQRLAARDLLPDRGRSMDDAAQARATLSQPPSPTTAPAAAAS